MRITSAKFVKGLTGTDDILFDGRPQIVFVGRSNVGKSSVINSLTDQKDLVKVGRKPGKTTEINFFLINNAFYFVDLPGYGYAKLGPLEKDKIRRMMAWYFVESGIKLKLVALIIDLRVGFTELDRQMVALLKDAGHWFVIIANKVDKLKKSEVSRQLAGVKAAAAGAEVLACSATTQAGIREVLDAILA